MKNYKLLLPGIVLALSACGVNTQNSAKQADTSSTAVAQSPADTSLFATMHIKDTIRVGDSVLLKFNVNNNTKGALRFCKWHTPFEPLMSKYLDVKNEGGEEAPYQGAMAKRMMPPPESSYITLQPKDSISANVDLLKGYAITKPGKYTIVYNSQNMSGLTLKDSVSFIYAAK
jgi:hypothetical protein